MERYSGQQLQNILNISKPTVKFRADKLGIKKTWGSMEVYRIRS